MKHVGAKWSEVVLVCRSCSKKLGGGFGPDGDQRLGKALRTEMARSTGLKAGKKTKRRNLCAVIEVGCLDICPKNAVMALHAAAPGDWIVVPRGTDASEVLAELRLGPRSSPKPPAGNAAAPNPDEARADVARPPRPRPDGSPDVDGRSPFR